MDFEKILKLLPNESLGIEGNTSASGNDNQSSAENLASSLFQEGFLSTLLSNPQIAQEVIRNLASQYKPVIYSVIKEGFEIYREFTGNTEFFVAKAQAARNTFEALTSKGFSEEQAMLLLIDAKAARETLLQNLAQSVGGSISN